MSKYKEAWVNIMMIEELELGGSEENPIKNALVTFVAFILFGLVPSNLLIYKFKLFLLLLLLLLE